MKRQLVKPLEQTGRTTRLSAADGLMSLMTPTLALCYRERLDASRLRLALARVLTDYSSFSGRVQRKGGDLFLEHGLGGAGFEVSESSDLSAVLGAAARASHSSLVCPHMSALGMLGGRESLFAARVTHTPDGSVLGVTWNHALGDYHSAMLLLRAWALAYRDRPHDKPLEVSDRCAYLKEMLPEAPSGSLAWRVLSWPEFFRFIHAQFWVARPVQRVALEFSRDEISAIHAAAGCEKSVTAYDALCAHIFLTLRRLLDTQVSPHFAIAINYRKRLGLPANLLGNLSDVVNTKASASDTTATIASALRRRVETFATGPIGQRDLAALKAAYPSALQQMRCSTQLSDPYRTNLILSNVGDVGHYELPFGLSAPVFVHARGTNMMAPGFGTIVKSMEGERVTVDMMLPRTLARRVAGERGRSPLSML